MKRVRQREVNEQLQKLGFGGLDDPELFKQMAICIGYTEPTLAGKHEHFRKFLLAVEPEKRTIAYEMIRPHLMFPARPLDFYILEGKREAEELQLPVRMPDGSMVSYKDYHGGTTEGPTLEMMAQDAITAAEAEKALILTCKKCTRQAKFPAAEKVQAYATAVKKGWAFDMRDDGEEVAICPKCPAYRGIRPAPRMAHA